MEKIAYLYEVKKEIFNNIKQTIMRTTNQKALDYLNSNPIVANFIEKVNTERTEYYAKINLTRKEPELIVEIGNKFIRLWSGTSCWGFISRVDGDLKGAPIKKGDLLKPATWKAPAKHARGNIIDGTAKYGVYGPEYIS
jgi:hypothetical protein